MALSHQRLQRLTDVAAVKRLVQQRDYLQAVAVREQALSAQQRVQASLKRTQTLRHHALSTGITMSDLQHYVQLEQHLTTAETETALHVTQASAAEDEARATLLESYQHERVMQRLTTRVRLRTLQERQRREAHAQWELITNPFVRQTSERR